jgi:hypothetical protein
MAVTRKRGAYSSRWNRPLQSLQVADAAPPLWATLMRPWISCAYRRSVPICESVAHRERHSHDNARLRLQVRISNCGDLGRRVDRDRELAPICLQASVLPVAEPSMTRPQGCVPSPFHDYK